MEREETRLEGTLGVKRAEVEDDEDTLEAGAGEAEDAAPAPTLRMASKREEWPSTDPPPAVEDSGGVRKEKPGVDTGAAAEAEDAAIGSRESWERESVGEELPLLLTLPLLPTPRDAGASGR